jgi:iron complex transport system permease protein
VLQALFHYDPRNFDQRIIVELRLVRLAAALLTGAALGVAGVLLQTVIRNPLGEPHILGLNAGASLAVVATSALGLSGMTPGRPLIAAGGARCCWRLRVTLCGVALSAFASAVTAAILILDEQTLLAMRTWLAGDLAGLNWPVLRTATLPALAGGLLALLIAPRLNVLALGDKVALGLGVNIVQTRLLGLGAIALLCGAAVAVAGPIGFVGLVVPHVIRRLVSEDIRLALPLAAPVGALVLLFADIAARTLVAPQELATGAMTALVGAPVFIFIAARFLNEKRGAPCRFPAPSRGELPSAPAPGGAEHRRGADYRHSASGKLWPDARQLPLPAGTLARALFAPENVGDQSRFILFDIRLPGC